VFRKHKQKGFLGKPNSSKKGIMLASKAFLRNKNGFLGAIGDDLPSLVPIFFSLLIFFSTLSFVFITLSDRNAYLETYFESISVSKEALGSSFFSDYNNFLDNINSINTTEKLIVGLINDPGLLADNLAEKEMFVQSAIIDGKEEFMLPNSIEQNNGDAHCTIDNCFSMFPSPAHNYYFYSNEYELNDSIDLYKIFKNNDPFLYLYPVALSTNQGVVNVYMYVLVW